MPPMNGIAALWRRVRSRMSRPQAERELDDELQFHIDMQTEENVRQGMSPDEARRQALILFGGVEGHREASRDLRRLRPLENLLADARFALRHFRRTPAATATMLLVLVLGLGVNAALFSAVQSSLTLPPAGMDRDPALVRIRGIQNSPRFGSLSRRMSAAEVREYAGLSQLFSSVTAWSDEPAALAPSGEQAGVSALRAVYVTEDYFGVLGISPVLGPGISPDNAAYAGNSSLVAVISQVLWDREFGRSADVIGSTLRVNGFPVEVVGVAPPAFEGAKPANDPVLWLPLSARPLLQLEVGERQEADPANFEIVARLRDGVSAAEAAPAVAAIGSRAAVQSVGHEPVQPSADVVPLLRENYHAGADRRIGQIVLLFGSVTLLILLITCTNVSGLLVGGAMARRREIAVRLSLGAGRWRVVRQLLTESLLLSLSAGMLAFLLLLALAGVIEHSFPDVELTIAWPSLLFAGILALIAALGFGLSPALHASRMEVGEVLKDAGATVSAPRSWLQRTLVVVQVALTQPLLVGLGSVVLLAGSEVASRPSRDVHEEIAALSFRTFVGNTTLEGRRQELEQLSERLRVAPGVVAVAPDDEGYLLIDVAVPDDDRVAGVRYDRPLTIRAELASPGYMEVLKIPVVRGRTFLATDWERDRSAIIIGQDLASSLWGEADPIGRRLRSGSASGDSADYTVVGVVDERAVAMTESGQPRVIMAATVLSRTLLVRTSGEAAPMLPMLRAVASAAAPDLPITEATTLAAQEAEQRGFVLRIGSMATAGGLLALLLSAIGLYGVVATTVSQRTREIGVRTALGARPGQVAAHFFAGGVRLAAIGLGCGLPLALLALKLFSARMEMPQASTATLATLIALGTIGVAALAAWVPARRAAGADPLIALRSD